MQSFLPSPPFIFFILKNNKKAERQKRHLQATLDTEAPAESFSITNPLRERSHFFWDLCNKYKNQSYVFF